VDKTQYAVFSQVRLADLVRTPFKGSGYDKVYLKTLPYHVDFVICRKPEYKICLAIELDGPHHSTAKQMERDIFKSHVLEEAGIPLIRFRVEENLTTETIQNRIRSYVSRKEQV
jgi:very-short-patch-repair endonuclease